MTNTREENAAEMARDEARDTLRQALAKDTERLLAADEAFRMEVALEGFTGWATLSDRELARNVRDAELEVYGSDAYDVQKALTLLTLLNL